ncbi:MAG: hypothetical protein KDA61_02345, partial [Planctomycetales bacterium]|nr:hypothetical protein [Planctomycetales bacterium]
MLGDLLVVRHTILNFLPFGRLPLQGVGALPVVRAIATRCKLSILCGFLLLATCAGKARAQQTAGPELVQPFSLSTQPPYSSEFELSIGQTPATSFRTDAYDDDSAERLHNNFTAFPDFEGGIVVAGENAALKIGGFIKADFISDFDPIDSTDSFITTDIPIGAADRQNARFHARQSRLSFDTRWKVDGEVARAYVEGDFLGGADGSNGTL